MIYVIHIQIDNVYIYIYYTYTITTEALEWWFIYGEWSQNRQNRQLRKSVPPLTYGEMMWRELNLFIDVPYGEDKKIMGWREYMDVLYHLL